MITFRFRRSEEPRHLMNVSSRTATFFLLAAAILTMPFEASALSVKQFESETKEQRVDFLMKTVDKIVADVAPVNLALSRAIHDYFDVTPAGAIAAPGKIAFEGALLAVEDSADKGKLDLDKVQVEGILLGVIKRDVMPKHSAKDKETPPDKKK